MKIVALLVLIAFMAHLCDAAPAGRQLSQRDGIDIARGVLGAVSRGLGAGGLGRASSIVGGVRDGLSGLPRRGSRRGRRGGDRKLL